MSKGGTHRQTIAAPEAVSGMASESLARPAKEGVQEPINILIVDDEPRNLTVLQSILNEPDYRLVCAGSAEQALLALISEQYALLILDVRMPGMSGLELAQLIKERKKTAQVPIIFLTAYYNEDQHVLEGYSAGAVDYLHKPVNTSILRSKVAVFVELYRRNREAVRNSEALRAEIEERRRADEMLRELNETLEHRVAVRTADLVESRARLRRAADLAKLTYFALDHVRGRIESADNFSSIMGFDLGSANGDDNPIAEGLLRLQDHIVAADQERIASEIVALKASRVRKVEYRVTGADGRERCIESEWHHETGPSGLGRTFVANLDITERKQSEEQKRLLMAEINHRSKNLLSVVQSLVAQSARGADPVTFASTLSDRLQGLSASQDLLIRDDWRSIDLKELVLAQLYHFMDLIGSRIILKGPPVRLKSTVVQALGMALHELGTNAAKYGSLSVNEGTVTIQWTVSEGDGRLFCVRWTEAGGPPVAAPARKGFGNFVVGRLVESAFAGEVELKFFEDGLVWKLSAASDDALEMT